MARELRVDIPDKLVFLFQPKRYKVAYGGRGSGKSHSFAKVLLLLGASKRIRVLCTREVQKSIKDSVHKLLSDQIELMGLHKHYRILETEIRGKNGTEFLFSGLSNQTANSIKSFEGVTHVWCEEAQSISKKSWNTLIPTIRKEGSEIWISFNPDLDTDETYVRFVKNPPPDAHVAYVNWSDNPWFPSVLEAERQHCYNTNREEYDNIWEGKTKAAIAGAIYAKELDELTRAQQIRPVPRDPALPVHAIFDLGWNDAMTILFVQKVASEVRVIDYIEESFKTLDWYHAESIKRYGAIGEWWLPHDGEHKDYKTGKSAKEIMEGYGCNVLINPRISIEEGIKYVRMMLKRCYFDAEKTARLLECLKRYRRSVNQQTLEPGAPVHDEFSHGCLVGESVVETLRGLVAIKDVVIGDYVATPVGFKRVVDAGVTGYAKHLIEITTTNGSTLVCTPDHWIFTQRGVHAADALRYNDVLFNGMELQCKTSGLISMVTGTGYRQAITNATTQKVAKDSCIGLFGKAFMATYRKALLSITKTMTRPTTQLKTLSASVSRAITSIIQKHFGQSLMRAKRKNQISLTDQRNGIGLTKEESASLRSMLKIGATENTTTTTLLHSTKVETSGLYQKNIESSKESMQGGLSMKESSSLLLMMRYAKQQNGIDQTLDYNGTQNMADDHGRVESPLRAFVSNVANRLIRWCLRVPNSAMQIAKLRHYEPEEKVPVYDLTVEDAHCYIASGVLVSNCDAIRYLAMCVDQLGSHQLKTSHPIFQSDMNLARFGAGGASRAGY